MSDENTLRFQLTGIRRSDGKVVHKTDKLGRLWWGPDSPKNDEFVLGHCKLVADLMMDADLIRVMAFDEYGKPSGCRIIFGSKPVAGKP